MNAVLNESCTGLLSQISIPGTGGGAWCMDPEDLHSPPLYITIMMKPSPVSSCAARGRSSNR